MKLMPFKDLIAMSKEKLDEAMAPVRASQVRKQAELEQLKIEADIIDKQTKIQEMCIGKEINFTKLMDALDDVALLERRKEQYNQVLQQLFPES